MSTATKPALRGVCDRPVPDPGTGHAARPAAASRGRGAGGRRTRDGAGVPAARRHAGQSGQSGAAPRNAVRRRRQSRQLSGRRRVHRRLATALRLRDQAGDEQRAAGRTAAAAARARSSSRGSTATAAPRMPGACCATRRTATRWCSSPRERSRARPACCKFHTGAFVIAARAGCPIVPAVVRGTRHALSPQGGLPARAGSRSPSCPRSSRRRPHRADRRRGAARSSARAAILQRAAASRISHVPAILTAHLIQRSGDLSERAHLHALHELREHVAAARGDLAAAARAPPAHACALRAWKARTAAT